jgi:hypothetical protein
MDFKNTNMHIISQLEPYYSLSLLGIAAQEIIAVITFRTVFIKYPHGY